MLRCQEPWLWTELSCPPCGLRQPHPLFRHLFLLQVKRGCVQCFPPEPLQVQGWRGGDPPGLVGCGDPGEPALALEEGVRCTPL